MNELVQNKIHHDIDGPLNFQEFNVTIKKLTLHTVLGLNGVPQMRLNILIMIIS